MSGLKDIVKGGWHPDKNGQRESWRENNKGINQVAGWVGKGKSTTTSSAESSHQSAPLSTLQDPSAFGPPPRHVATGAGPVVSPRTTTPTNSFTHPGAGGSGGNSSGGGGGGGPPPIPSGKPIPPGKPRSQENQIAQRPTAGEEPARPAPASGLYRADTTGLSTANLPPPPVRRANQTGQPAPPPSASGVKPKPALPPRLPPRQNSNPNLYTPAPPPPYSEVAPKSPSHGGGLLNQGALGRLGQAGISVPGLDIGRTGSPPVPPRATASPSSSASTGVANAGQLNELQSRFSRMSTGSSSAAPSAAPSADGGGTTLAQKQAAVKTAAAFRNDPSSVSMADMRSTASTLNNFRERHGDQVASGLQTANGLNQKYGVMDRANRLASGASPGSPSGAGKKPPPPPPKKRVLGGSDGVGGAGATETPPPPIPLGSRPRT